MLFSFYVLLLQRGAGKEDAEMALHFPGQMIQQPRKAHTFPSLSLLYLAFAVRHKGEAEMALCFPW